MRRFGQAAKRWLVDGRYTDRADIDWAASSEGGAEKVRAALLWHAIAHNITRLAPA